MTKPRTLRLTLPFALLCVAIGATCGEEQVPTPPGDPSGDVDASVVRGEIGYDADLLIMESFPVQLVGRAKVKNLSDRRRTVTFPDGCVALLRAYGPEGGAPVWDQAQDLGCTMALVPVELAPGEERVLPTPTASAREILGDLPDGQYRIAVYLRPIKSDVVEIDVGATDLAIPR